MYIVFAVKNAREKSVNGTKYGQSAGAIIVSVLSCIFTLIIVIIGVLAVIKKSRTLCLYVRYAGFFFLLIIVVVIVIVFVFILLLEVS